MEVIRPRSPPRQDDAGESIGLCKPIRWEEVGVAIRESGLPRKVGG